MLHAETQRNPELMSEVLLMQRRNAESRKMTAGDVADLCALCDGVSLLWAEVRQDVCRVPLTGVMNSWTSCI